MHDPHCIWWDMVGNLTGACDCTYSNKVAAELTKLRQEIEDYERG